MNIVPGTDRILAVPFEIGLKSNGKTAKFFPLTMREIFEWASHRKTEILQAMKTAGITDMNVILNVASSSVTDALGTMTSSTEGRLFLITRSHIRAGGDGSIADELVYDEANFVFRQIAGRGGLLSPNSKEEADEWNREWVPPPPQKTSSDEKSSETTSPSSGK